MEFYTGMNKAAEKQNFVVVYPEALKRKWPYLNCNAQKDEISYFRTLFRSLRADYRVDTSRIYLVGMSAGGFEAGHLLANFPDKIAGLGIVASSELKDCTEYSGLIPKPKIPFTLVIGTDDYFYHDQKNNISADSAVASWIVNNDCKNIPVVDTMADINTRDHSQVVRYRYKSKTNADVLMYKVLNGGHHWPGSRFNANWFYFNRLGEFNRDINTSELILSSFKKG